MEHLPLSALTCGLRISLIAEETTKSKWATILVGARLNQYFLVETPRLSGVSVKFDEGTFWGINFIRQGHLYSFKTQVLGNAYRPSPLVFFQYPKEVEILHLRDDKRYPVHIPAIITFVDDEGQEQEGRGLVMDISPGGCLLATTSNVPGDVPVSLTMHLSDGEVIDGLVGEIKTRSLRGDAVYCGLSFAQASSPDAMGRLDDLMKNLEKAALRL